MNSIKSIKRRIHEHLYKYWVKTHFHKFKSFNKHLSYSGIAKLTIAVPGAYKFYNTYCDKRIAHRLLEMGFIPNEKIIVIENNGHNGSIIVKVKGSKIALNHRLADKILIKRK
ncbi:MAG: ferrous iron transport protein A [Endomicrobium sp.]|jgi:Fe2+ transport system protein FeoA|nr:ferrous iron transport protein A [Endomicrobium sp.]